MILLIIIRLTHHWNNRGLKGARTKIPRAWHEGSAGCGIQSHRKRIFAFQDILEKGEKSKYLDWYFIDELPPRGEWGEIPNFKCFGYYGGMPKLNLKNPEVEKYITDVACYWIKECDIDGWRLDVGDEISHFFWKNFRKAIKAVKKDMLIIGEIWHYAGDFLEEMSGIL